MERERIIEILLASLERAFKNNKAIKGFCRQLVNFPKDTIELSRLDFLRDGLRDCHSDLKPYALRVLCHYGMDVREFEDIVMGESQKFARAYIECAEKQYNGEALLFFVDEKNRYFHDVVIILKRMGEEHLLTSLLFSDDVSLSDSIKSIIEI